MDAPTLPSDLQEFAREVISAGRYRDVSEMIEAAVGLLKRAEMERTAFIASLEAAQAEGERSGFFTIEDVEAELDAIIDDAERRGA